MYFSIKMDEMIPVKVNGCAYYVHCPDFNFELDRHNLKRLDLGMSWLKHLPSKEEIMKVDEDHLRWQYRIGGEKWTLACNLLEN